MALVIGGNLAVNGTSGSPCVWTNVDITSIGGTATATYCTVTGSTNSGTAVTCTNCTDGGGNTGWTFGGAGTVTGTLDSTQASDTFLASALIGIGATVSKTQASDSISSSVVFLLSAILDKTQAGDSIDSDYGLYRVANLSSLQDGNSLNAISTVATSGYLSESSSGDISVAHASLSTYTVLYETQDSDSVIGICLFIGDATFALNATQESDSVYSKIKGSTTNENYYFLLNRRDEDGKREPIPV